MSWMFQIHNNQFSSLQISGSLSFPLECLEIQYDLRICILGVKKESKQLQYIFSVLKVIKHSRKKNQAANDQCVKRMGN